MGIALDSLRRGSRHRAVLAGRPSRHGSSSASGTRVVESGSSRRRIICWKSSGCEEVPDRIFLLLPVPVPPFPSPSRSLRRGLGPEKTPRESALAKTVYSHNSFYPLTPTSRAFFPVASHLRGEIMGLLPIGSCGDPQARSSPRDPTTQASNVHPSLPVSGRCSVPSWGPPGDSQASLLSAWALGYPRCSFHVGAAR
jgi:hypothetical protein